MSKGGCTRSRNISHLLDYTHSAVESVPGRPTIANRLKLLILSSKQFYLHPQTHLILNLLPFSDQVILQHLLGMALWVNLRR